MCLSTTAYKKSDLPTLQKESDTDFLPAPNYKFVEPLGRIDYANETNRKRIYQAFGFPFQIDTLFETLKSKGFDFAKVIADFFDNGWIQDPERYGEYIKSAWKKFGENWLHEKYFIVTAKQIEKGLSIVEKHFENEKTTCEEIEWLEILQGEVSMFRNALTHAQKDGYVLVEFSN